MNFLGDGKPFDLPSIISDPFKEDKVESIALFFYTRRGTWGGSVKFKNGKTTGEQDLVEAESLDGIVAQIKAIIESIKNKT